MGKKAPAAPDLSGFLNAYKELGGRYMTIAEEQSGLAKDRFAALDPLNMQMMQAQVDAQGFANEQARDNQRFYRENYRPIEQKLIDDANNFNTEAERERLASQAGADAEQALATQRGSAMRQLERMGVNPNSGRFMQLMSDTGLGAAKMRSQAENTARVQARDAGLARLGNVANMGRGYAANTIGFMGAGTGAGTAGAGMMGASDRVGNMYNTNSMNAMAGYGGTIGGGAGIVNSDYNNRMSSFNANNQAMGGMGQLMGMGAGMFFADGGMVRGPGTGTSDDVPAVNEDTGQPIRLSNGEYVLPAKTVRMIGLEKLDEVVEKTNGKLPVHKQGNRGAQRSRALSR